MHFFLLHGRVFFIFTLENEKKFFFKNNPNARALTFIIGKLEVVIHGGYKLLHKVAAHAGRQVLLASYLTLQRFHVEI